ncbi:MAG: tetratricopeptide repeat protein, partial [Candidatus Marinimicrobia bacterium]|nr:tetratricopeptide repeat protein [Candidatus Neomarinimicrobiota bacterium]
IKDLRVSARTSAFAFKGQQQDIREIGQKLNVATVLEGSVRKSDNRLRISAQLINVADGYHLWSEKYDRELKDVFAIQDEIAGNIVQALRVMLSDSEKRTLEELPTDSIEAYDYYLRGRKFFYELRVRSFDFARQMFTKATAIDPNYALAYAGLADCSSWLYAYLGGKEENLKEAEQASRKALELDPELAEAHVARGHALTLRQQYGEAEREFEIALGLNPRLFEAYFFYGRACLVQGKREQAAQLFKQASEVRPEDIQAPSFLATVYTGLGRGAEAKAARRRALDTIENHLELNPHDTRALYFGAGALVELGKREEGLAWAKRALEIEPDEPAVLYNVGCVYSLAGEIEDAIDCIEKVLGAGLSNRAWVENDSDLDPLRSHPRFQALLAKMK